MWTKGADKQHKLHDGRAGHGNTFAPKHTLSLDALLSSFVHPLIFWPCWGKKTLNLKQHSARRSLTLTLDELYSCVEEVVQVEVLFWFADLHRSAHTSNNCFT